MIEDIGKRIRSAREAYGMTQLALSRRIGISTTAMNDLEQGRTVDPRLSHVVAIADTLKISLDTLLGREALDLNLDVVACDTARDEVPHADA